jgi:N-methylhydantoinase A
VPGEARPDPSALREAFGRAHEERYGYTDADSELELVTVRAAVALDAPELPAGEPPRAESRDTRQALFDGERVEAEVVRGAPESVTGPAIVELPESTLVVPPGWRCSAGEQALTMERARSTR